MACLKKTTLAFLATVFALGIGESLVRLLGDVPEVKPIWVSSSDYVYQRSSNPILSYELKANYRCDDPDLNQQYESTNSHGLRDKERTLSKPDGVRRVILLGDSVVEGNGIRQSETISRTLEELVSPDNTEVLNFAVSGYCTRAEVELLETKGLAFDPDVVVLVFVNHNDFVNFNEEAFLLKRQHDRPTAVKYLFLYSQLFRQAALGMNLYGFGSDADPSRWNRQAIGENNVVSGLRRLRQLSRQHDFLTLVAIWPVFSDTEIADRHFMPASSGELVIERLCRMLGIPVVRLSEDFIRDFSAERGSDSPRIRYTNDDGMHPSPVGCRVAAQALKTHLAMLTEGNLAAESGSGDPAQAHDDYAAIAAAAELGAQEPNKGEVYNNLGLRSLDSGDLAQAITYFQSSLQENGTNHRAHINWGMALERLGRYEEAIVHYQEAARIKPDSDSAQNNWGAALVTLGRFDMAAAHFQEALRIKPDHAEAHYNWGVALQRLGRFEEALTRYQDALRVKPDYAEAHNNLGTTLQGLGRIVESIAHFQEALRIKHDYAGAHANLGLAYEKMGRIEEAVAHYQEALRITPDNAEVYNNCGILLAKQERLAEAIRHFQQAVRLNPDFTEARKNLHRAEVLLQEKQGSD